MLHVDPLSDEWWRRPDVSPTQTWPGWVGGKWISLISPVVGVEDNGVDPDPDGGGDVAPEDPAELDRAHRAPVEARGQAQGGVGERELRGVVGAIADGEGEVGVRRIAGVGRRGRLEVEAVEAGRGHQRRQRGGVGQSEAGDGGADQADGAGRVGGREPQPDDHGAAGDDGRVGGEGGADAIGQLEGGELVGLAHGDGGEGDMAHPAAAVDGQVEGGAAQPRQGEGDHRREVVVARVGPLHDAHAVGRVAPHGDAAGGPDGAGADLDDRAAGPHEGQGLEPVADLAGDAGRHLGRRGVGGVGEVGAGGEADGVHGAVENDVEDAGRVELVGPRLHAPKAGRAENPSLTGRNFEPAPGVAGQQPEDAGRGPVPDLEDGPVGVGRGDVDQVEGGPHRLHLPAVTGSRPGAVEAVGPGVEQDSRLVGVERRLRHEQGGVDGLEAVVDDPGPHLALDAQPGAGMGGAHQAREHPARDPLLPRDHEAVGVVGIEGHEAAVGGQDRRPRRPAGGDPHPVVLEAAAVQGGHGRALGEVVHLGGGDAVAQLAPGGDAVGDGQRRAPRGVAGFSVVATRPSRRCGRCRRRWRPRARSAPPRRRWRGRTRSGGGRRAGPGRGGRGPTPGP